MNTVGNLGGALAGIATGRILDWHTGPFPAGTPAYEAAKNQGSTVNIILFGTAYLIAVVCWLFFDATKPVAYRAAERKTYERAWPIGWGRVKLADYLGEET